MPTLIRATCAPAVIFFLAGVFAAPAGYPEAVDSRVDSRVGSNLISGAGRGASRGDNMKQFRDSKGNVILTNRVDKYRKKKGYVELKINYEPIKVSTQYKAMPSAKSYTSKNIEDLVKHYSKMYLLDENLVYAVIRCESNFDPYAVSSAGARGLMQLMPETAADMGVTDVFDPAQNIAGGTQYLAKMLNIFDNNVELALAAYNAGPQAVKDHGGIPPYKETQAYVRNVCKHAGILSKGGAALKATYAVKSAAKPSANALPVAKKAKYVIHFRSGLTQPVDKIIDEDPYYYVTFGNRTALVRKENVAKIVES